MFYAVGPSFRSNVTGGGGGGGQKVDVISWAKRAGGSCGTALEYGNDRQRRAEWDNR